MLHTFASSVVDLFKANPIAFLVTAGGLWVLGWARRQARRPKGNLLLGILEVLALAGWIHKNRHNVSRAAAWCILAATAAAWALVIWFRPDVGLRLVLPATVAALAFAAFWVDDRIGDTPIRKVIADWVDGKGVRQAVAVTPEVRVGRPRALPTGGWETPVHVADGTELDAVAAAARANARGIDVRSVEVIPGDRIGNAVVRLSPKPPEPEIDPWVALAESRAWPGRWSDEPDAEIPVGVDARGRTLYVPRPGKGGSHLLIAGATGAGKSALLATIVAELAHRRHTAIVFLDPARVEARAWRPRATTIYSGIDACQAGLSALVRHMEEREHRLDRLGKRNAPVGDDWPVLVIVVDEVAALTGSKGADLQAANDLAEISERARKVAIGLVLATQRPEVGTLPGRLRDNLRSRVALGHTSGDASRMTLGVGAPLDASHIPESLPGAFILRRDRSFVEGRGWLLRPAQNCPPDEEIEAAAEEIAAATEHLRISGEDL
jgi:hypothetical protein